MADGPDIEPSVKETVTLGTDSKPRRRRAAKGPDVRDTLLHRRQEVIQVSVRDLKTIRAFLKEEAMLYTGGNFLWSGGVWLAIDEGMEGGLMQPIILVCAIAIFAGVILSLVGWRQMRRASDAINDLLAEVEEKEVT